MYATVNHKTKREVRRQALVNLALYREVYPKSLILDTFSHPAVLQAEAVLGLRRETASTTCKRAYWGVNLHKREQLWAIM